MFPTDPSSVIPQKTLVTVVLSCLLLAAWFVPNQRELVHRLDHDGHKDRVKQLAEERLAEQAPTLTLAAPQTDREKLGAWLTSQDPAVLEDPAVQADRKNLCATTNTPAEMGAELISHAERIDPELFDAMADALVRRALGLGDPAGAAALLTDWFHIHPSWEIAGRQIQAWRWAVRSDEALKALDTALASNLDAAQRPENVDDLRVKLAVESNQPNLAFDIIIRNYESAAPADRPGMLRRLVELATAGDRTTEASHLIGEHFKTMPFQTRSLEEAVAMVGGGTAFPNAAAENDYKQYASAMARWQEWAGRGDVAFDTWLRLAVLGDEEAWARALDLHEELLRKADFAVVLEDRIAHGKHLEAEPLLAEILIDDGRTHDAIRHLEAAASRAAEPAPMRLLLGRIHEQSGEWAKALASFDAALAHDPTNIESQKGRAFALVRLRRFEDGCQAWLAISRQAVDDVEAQETCAALCDSLGYSGEALAATQRLLACRGRASAAEEHLDLAAQFHQRADSSGEVAALRTGFAQFPSSTLLRISLAESLSGVGDETIRLLSDPSVRNHPVAVELLIAEAADWHDAPEGCDLFNGPMPDCLKDLPQLQLRLALLFDQWGRRSDSEKIVASLQKESRYRETAVWHHLARISLDAGDAARAESFEALQLSSTGVHDSSAWEMLGDIYKVQDRAHEAAGAYQKAVQILLPSSPAASRPQPQITQTSGR